MQIELRAISLEDLEAYEYWKQPHHAYHDLNGPYFEKTTSEQIRANIQQLKTRLLDEHPNPMPNRKMISNTQNALIGEVSWYWKSQETNWLEIGIVIFDEQYWGQGIGKRALTLWVNEIFAGKPTIVRLGLTTWSGNKGMMRLSEKLGMKLEAQYRKARIVDGKYYDSVSYGLLREEWFLSDS